MPKFDAVDLHILKLLQMDGRMTIREVASHLDMTTTPIFERIKRLEKRGVISHYAAILDPHKLGKMLNAFIHISIIDHSRKALQAFISQITAFEEVMECHHVSGDADFFVKVVVGDMAQYNDFILKRLSKVENIGNVKSSFSLSVSKSSTVYHLRLGELPKEY